MKVDPITFSTNSKAGMSTSKEHASEQTLLRVKTQEMEELNNLPDCYYPGLNNMRFIHRMNHYDKIFRWLVVANIVVWPVAIYTLIKWLSV